MKNAFRASLIFACILNSCGAPETAGTPSDIPLDTVSAPAASDSEIPGIDYDSNPNVRKIDKPVNATLGFSYYPAIPQNETRDLRVFVKTEGTPSAVRHSIRQLEREELEFTKLNDSSVVCIIRDIQAYNKLSVKPLYDAEDFKVTAVDNDERASQADPNEQILDFVKGNYWHWKIKAVAATAHVGNITLLIKAETPTGERVKLAEKQINIKIDINDPELTFSEKVYNFADKHFKEILSLIVIPLLIYLFNFLRKRINAQKNNPPTE